MVRYQPPMDWQQWVNWLAAGLHGRNRWRLSLILLGMLFAKGRRTVTTWLRAAGVHDDFADYYYFLQPLGRKSKQFAARLFTILLLRMTPERVVLAVDDTPTKRVMGRRCKAQAFVTIPRPVRPIRSFCMGTFG